MYKRRNPEERMKNKSKYTVVTEILSFTLNNTKIFHVKVFFKKIQGDSKLFACICFVYYVDCKLYFAQSWLGLKC